MVMVQQQSLKNVMILFVLAVLLGVGFSFLGASSNAHAAEVKPTGGSCTLGCSETINRTSVPVLAGRNWCSSSEGPIYQDSQPCSGETRWLQQNESTPDGQDWDTFRVDRGWKYTYRIYVGPVWTTHTVDRRHSSTGAWIRVHNYQTAVVTKQ